MRAGSRPAIALALLALTASCGGSSSHSETGLAASTASVAVTGHVASRGTKGSVLVYAYTDLGSNDDPVGREPASVGIVSPDGAFDLSVPPGPTLTLVFLADASNDGVVDQGDSIAALTGPELADLQAGDRVHVADASVDFLAHRATGTLEVTRVNEPSSTPTALP